MAFQSPAADLILYHAAIVTMNPAQPRAGALAVRGDAIAGVGALSDIAGLRGPRTELIDCRGKAIVPGFIDAHTHFLAFAASLASVNCRPDVAPSIEDIKAAIRRRAAAVPPDQWIRAHGYHEFYLPEGRHPTRWDLDEAAPDHPVRLLHQSGHACVLNSLALRRAGITIATEEPPGGAIERDVTGEPNGLLYEMEGFVAERADLRWGWDELRESAAAASRHYLALGVTSLHDATASNDLDQEQTFSKLQAQGAVLQRVYLMMGRDALDGLRERSQERRSGGDSRRPAGSSLRLGAVKVVLGSITGRLHPPQEELNQTVLSIHQAGLQLAIHAVEEAEVEAAISALEAAQRTCPRPGSRHRVEHCSVASLRLVRRLENLRAVVVTQPAFVYHNGQRYLATVPSQQQPWLYPIRTLTDNAVPTAASSDAPVILPSPVEAIYAAVARRARSGQEVAPAQGVSATMALWMHTMGGAYASFEEDRKGSIEAGKLADLAILSGDPTNLPVEAIKDIQVEMTILGGQVVWARR